MNDRNYPIVKNKILNFKGVNYLLTPPGFGKSVNFPSFLSGEIKILVVVQDQLYLGYFENRTKNKRVKYISSDELWNEIINSYDSNSICKLNWKYDLVIFDDYSNENIEYNFLIKLILNCNYINLLLQSSNSTTLVPEYFEVNDKKFKVNRIIVPYHPFHTDIRYHDSNYNFDDPILLKDLSKLIKQFNESTVEGNFLIILPKSFMVNKLYQLISEINALVFKFTHYDSLASLNELLSNQTQDETNQETQRKIIIITDTLESLLSLNRIGIIFETGYQSSVQNTLSGGRRRVVKQITEERLNKYCSRLNVLFPGICFRMFTTDMMKKKIQSQNLQSIVGIFWHQLLQLKSKGIENLLLTSEIKNPILIESLKTVELLNICKNPEDKECLFSAGSILSIRNSMILFNLLKSKYLLQYLILVSFIDCFDSQFYFFPRKNKNEVEDQYSLRLNEFKQKMIVEYAGYNELDTFINIWNRIEFNPLNFEDQSVIDFARAVNINQIKLFQLLKTIKKMIEYCKLKIKPDEDWKLIEDINRREEFLNQLKINYNDRILTLDENRDYYLDEKKNKYRIENQFTRNLLLSDPPEKLIDLIDIKTKLESGLSFIILGIEMK
jgi:hypothetical protein